MRSSEYRSRRAHTSKISTDSVSVRQSTHVRALPKVWMRARVRVFVYVGSYRFCSSLPSEWHPDRSHPFFTLDNWSTDDCQKVTFYGHPVKIEIAINNRDDDAPTLSFLSLPKALMGPLEASNLTLTLSIIRD